MTWNLEELLPHRAPMVFLDRVESYDPDLRTLTAVIEITSKHVLYSQAIDGVPNWAAIEFMAQASAALAGVFDKAQDPDRPARPGLLLGTRKLDVRVESFANGRTYSVSASCEFWDEEGAAFSCSISDDSGSIVAEAALNAFRPQNLQQFLKEQSET